MSLIDFAPDNWIILGIAIAIAIGFACRQTYYYNQNRKRISALRSFFQAKKSDYSTCSRDDVTLINTIKRKEKTPLNNLIQEINLYVQKSIGTADFNLIQNKTERCVESMYEHATAELSFPTYYGLMGTFSGTFLGLIGFLVSGSDFSDESKVTNLIIGVLVSMATSLFGLALTTCSNHAASSAKKELDEQKNEFLDFIQLELIPKLQTTVTTLQQTMEGFVPKFNEVIYNFELTFTKIIGRFKTTFDECTNNFGTEFRLNSSHISETVATLNESIGKITSNVENQRLLLEELRSEKMFDTLQQFINSAQTFRSSSNSIDGYNLLLQRLLDSTQAVVYKQYQFAESLSIPRELVLNIKSLLDRISTFEESINALGENIEQSEMLGNKEIELVNRHIESLEEKKQLADRFLDTSNEELERLFLAEKQMVKSIFESSRQQLEDERNVLNSFVNETLQIINKKKTDLLTQLENAFDVSHVHAMFTHLKTLPDIKKHLEDLERSVVQGSQLEQHVHNLLDSVVQLGTIVNNCSSDQKKAITTERKVIESIIEAVGEQEKEELCKFIRAFSEQASDTRNEIAVIQDNLDERMKILDAEIKTVQTNINETQLCMEKKLQTTTNELQSGISKVSDATKYLQRDIVKEIGTNLSGELRRIHASISEQSRKSEENIRIASNQLRQDTIQQSSATKQEMTFISSNLTSVGEQIQKLLDAINKRNKDGQAYIG